MTIATSNLILLEPTHYSTSLGDVYFFNNFVISEFKEGVNIDNRSFYEIRLLLDSHFHDRPFGFIANRVKSYSIFVNDAILCEEKYPNLKAYGIVYYKNLTKQIAEIENYFFNFNRKIFSDLTLAIDWVEETISEEE